MFLLPSFLAFIIELFAFYTFFQIYRSESCPNALFVRDFPVVDLFGAASKSPCAFVYTNTDLDGRMNCFIFRGCLVNKIYWSASCGKFSYIYSCLSTGNSYKFKVGTKANALRWYTYVREATKEKLDYKVSIL